MRKPYFDVLIFSLIAEISFTHRCRSLCDISRASSRLQWKWYAMKATSLKMFFKG